MINEEKFTVKFFKYFVTNGRVSLFPVCLDHATLFQADEKITSAGLACIWKKGNITQIICGDEGVSFPVLSMPELDQQLIAKYLGI